MHPEHLSRFDVGELRTLASSAPGVSPGHPASCRSRVDHGRRAALPPSVSHDLPPNRTCAFRYASGFPGIMVKSGWLMLPSRNRSTVRPDFRGKLGALGTDSTAPTHGYPQNQPNGSCY
jgi:hypothetical protein